MLISDNNQIFNSTIINKIIFSKKNNYIAELLILADVNYSVHKNRPFFLKSNNSCKIVSKIKININI